MRATPIRIHRFVALGLVLSACTGEIPPDDSALDERAEEEIGTAGEALLGSSHAQAFGYEHGTPDFGNAYPGGTTSVGLWPSETSMATAPTTW